MSWIKRNALYFKMSAVLMAMLAVLGIIYVVISGYTARKYFDEFQQILHGHLADSISAHIKPFVDGQIDTAEIQHIMHSIMVANPSAEVYLLNPNGEIITFMAPQKKIKLERVNMVPIMQFLSDDRPSIVKGDDPRHPGEFKIFSASPIDENEKRLGYLYVILESEIQNAVSGSLIESYFFRLGLGFFFIALAVALLAGLIAIWYLTKKLAQISAAVRRFKEGDMDVRIDVAEGDWKELAETFNAMADTINRNIDSLKSVEALRRELIANISHDLRTPLSILKGYIETLQMKKETLTEEEREKYLGIAFRSSEDLSHLVTQLFDYAKLEARQITPEKEPFQMADLVMDIIQKYQLIAKEKNIKLKLNAPGQLPFVFADLSLVERAIQNLMDNALNFTQTGGEIEIQLSDMQDTVEVCVTDNGPGIPEVEQAYIFERYRKARKDANSPKGAGLGLSIVKKIMELHDATIRVKSKLNEGTAFMFQLPVVQ